MVVALLLVAAGGLEGVPGVDTLEGAHRALGVELGPTVALLFAVGLLVSGLASTAVGVQAGAVVMAGLAPFTLARTTRRLITLVPAVALLAVGAEPTRLLVSSQALLSLGIPVVTVPLVRLATPRSVMGDAVPGRVPIVIAWLATGLIGLLDLGLVGATVLG